MGKRGPKSQPTAILKLHGSRRAKQRVDEPDVEVAAPECPGWLPEKAKVEWERIVPELIDRRTIARADMAVLADYCQAVAQFADATEYLAEHGYYTETDKGNEILHPMASILNNASARISRGAAHFGLSPSAKSGVKASDGGESKEKTKDRFFRGPRLAG